ncbi:MAG: GNAT family N-acetyltransferase [Steroidobacteraceae bacterium]
MPSDGVRLRTATPGDVPALHRLVERSARVLSAGYYTPAEIESAMRHVFGVDLQLIEDGTYFVAEQDGRIVGAGGWSRRRPLPGGEPRPGGGARALDPAREAARIRAFFVDPAHARRGIGRRLLQACLEAAGAAGFRRLELVATLAGEPLYSACGFSVIKEELDVLPDGRTLRLVRMGRPLAIEDMPAAALRLPRG